MSLTWRRWLGGALAVAALGFLGWTIASEWAELQRHEWDVDAVQLAGSLIALVAVLAWGVWVWGRVLLRLRPEPVPLRHLLRIWFYSSLARYVPGKIWQFVGAANMARSAGVAGPVLLTSMVVQMGFTMLSAAIVSIALLFPAGLALEPATTAVLAAAAGASVLLVHPAVLNAALRLVPKALHQEVMRWDGRWSDGLVLLGLSVLSWIAYGAAFTLFVDALVEIPLATLVPLTGANALAFLVGYIVFLAPAGLGAREAALTVLLGPYAPTGIAAVVAVSTRLWTIAAEVIGAAAVLVIGGHRRSSGGGDGAGAEGEA